MNPTLARVRLAGKLSAKVSELAALQKSGQPVRAIDRARLASEISALLSEMGGGAATRDGGMSQHEKALIAIASGTRDAESLSALYGAIQEAVNALEEQGIDATEKAQAAITRWAELEEKTNV